MTTNKKKKKKKKAVRKVWQYAAAKLKVPHALNWLRTAIRQWQLEKWVFHIFHSSRRLLNELLCAIKTKKIQSNRRRRRRKKKIERQPSQFTRITNHGERSSDHHCVVLPVPYARTHDYSGMSKFIHRGLSFCLFICVSLSGEHVHHIAWCKASRSQFVNSFFLFLLHFPTTIVNSSLSLSVSGFFTPNGFLTGAVAKKQLLDGRRTLN